jgi:hypothetical protein
MPHAAPSWRLWPQLRWISKTLCFIRIHHWMMSRTLGKPIACAVCSMKTRYYQMYVDRVEGGSERIKKDP